MEKGYYENGFYKVGQSGGSYVVAYLFNPETKEEKSFCVRDYDYCDCSRDNDDLYNLPINEEVRRLYLRHHGIISAGDTVRVVKGRKIPIGTVATVERIYDWRDAYGRIQTVYAVFTNGLKTNINNCVLV